MGRPHVFSRDPDGTEEDCSQCPLSKGHPDHIETVHEDVQPTASLPSAMTPPSEMILAPETPLAAVRQYISERVDEGVQCPACQQRAQVYRRTITGKMAAFLIELSRRPTDADGWVYIPAMTHAQGDSVKLRYWGLIEGLVGLRDDGSNRVGYWRITEAGRDFVGGDLRVPKHARVYDGESLGLDAEAGYVTIRDCLGTRFNYDALMSGAA